MAGATDLSQTNGEARSSRSCKDPEEVATPSRAGWGQRKVQELEEGVGAIHSFNIHLFCTCCMPGSVPGPALWHAQSRGEMWVISEPPDKDHWC